MRPFSSFHLCETTPMSLYVCVCVEWAVVQLDKDEKGWKQKPLSSNIFWGKLCIFKFFIRGTPF